MLKGIIASLAVVLGASLVVAQAAAEGELSGVLKTRPQYAEEFYKQKNWGELEKLTAEWTIREPDNGDLWYYRGVALFHLGKLQPAIHALTTASPLLADGDKQTDLVKKVGVSYERIQNWPLAERYYRLSLKENDKQPWLWHDLWKIVHEQTKVPEPAIVVLKEKHELELLPQLFRFQDYYDDLVLRRRHLTLLVKLERQDALNEAYRHIVRLEPDDQQAWEWLFEDYREKGDAEKVAVYKEHLLKFDKEHPMVFFYDGERALARGLERQAKRFFEVAVKSDRYPAPRAKAYTFLGRMEKARQASLDLYMKAIQSDPSYLPAWEEIVVLYRFQQDKQKSNAYFARMRVVQERLNRGEEVTPDVLEGL